MTKKRIAACFLLSFMLLFAGCAAYKLLHSTKLEEPKIEFSGYRIERMTNREAEVDFIVRAENPNPVGIKGVSADYELYVDESRFATGNAVAVELPPGGETAITVPVVVYQELLKALGPVIERFLSNRKSMPITVKVKVYGNPRLYGSNTEEGLLPPFQKTITRTLDIPLPDGQSIPAGDRLEKTIRSLF